MRAPGYMLSLLLADLRRVHHCTHASLGPNSDSLAAGNKVTRGYMFYPWFIFLVNRPTLQHVTRPPIAAG